MPRVSALRPLRRDRVGVELDGAPWRTLPAAAVVAAGLRPGLELDRSRLRTLGRELRRVEALERAAGALARRDHSRAELRGSLERRGVRAAASAEALETMARLGYLDDDRFAAARAERLAGRGYGDEAIRADLERRGFETETIRRALAALDSEPRRAQRFLDTRPAPNPARALASRGFSEDTVAAVVDLPEW